MLLPRECYSVLGVRYGADDDVVRSAFLEQARLWHPDRCSAPDAAERFRLAREAFETLTAKRGLTCASASRCPRRASDVKPAVPAATFAAKQGQKRVGRPRCLTMPRARRDSSDGTKMRQETHLFSQPSEGQRSPIGSADAPLAVAHLIGSAERAQTVVGPPLAPTSPKVGYAPIQTEVQCDLFDEMICKHIEREEKENVERHHQEQKAYSAGGLQDPSGSLLKRKRPSASKRRSTRQRRWESCSDGSSSACSGEHACSDDFDSNGSNGTAAQSFLEAGHDRTNEEGHCQESDKPRHIELHVATARGSAGMSGPNLLAGGHDRTSEEGHGRDEDQPRHREVHAAGKTRCDRVQQSASGCANMAQFWY